MDWREQADDDPLETCTGRIAWQEYIQIRDVCAARRGLFFFSFLIYRAESKGREGKEREGKVVMGSWISYEIGRLGCPSDLGNKQQAVFPRRMGPFFFLFSDNIQGWAGTVFSHKDSVVLWC